MTRNTLTATRPTAPLRTMMWAERQMSGALNFLGSWTEVCYPTGRRTFLFGGCLFWFFAVAFALVKMAVWAAFATLPLAWWLILAVVWCFAALAVGVCRLTPALHR